MNVSGFLRGSPASQSRKSGPLRGSSASQERKTSYSLQTHFHTVPYPTGPLKRLRMLLQTDLCKGDTFVKDYERKC